MRSLAVGVHSNVEALDKLEICKCVGGPEQGDCLCVRVSE